VNKETRTHHCFGYEKEKADEEHQPNNIHSRTGDKGGLEGSTAMVQKEVD